jgi:hypothetical protein
VAARGPWVIFVYGMRPRFWGDLRPVPQLRQLGDIAGDSRYRAATALKAEQQLRQFRHVDRDPPRAHSLALGELSHLSTVDSE